MKLAEALYFTSHVYIEYISCSATSSQEQTDPKMLDCTLACESVLLSMSRPPPLLLHFLIVH